MNTQNSIIEQVNTVDDALKIAGKTREQITSPTDTKDEAAYKLLKACIKVLNQDWVPDYDNRRQSKYEPRFYKPSSGSGLSCNGYDYWDTDTFCGVRLCYANYDLMKHGVKIFAELYNDFLL